MRHTPALALALATALATSLATSLALPRPAHAQSACAPGSLAAYVALGAGGCRVAGIHVHDFERVVVGFDLDPALVQLTPRAEAASGGGAWLGFVVSAPFGPQSLS